MVAETMEALLQLMHKLHRLGGLTAKDFSKAAHPSRAYSAGDLVRELETQLGLESVAGLSASPLVRFAD